MPHKSQQERHRHHDLPRWVYEAGVGLPLTLVLWGVVGIVAAVLGLVGVHGIPTEVMLLIATGPSFNFVQWALAPDDEVWKLRDGWPAGLGVAACSAIVLANDLYVGGEWASVFWPAVVLAVLSPAWPAARWAARSGRRDYARTPQGADQRIEAAGIEDPSLPQLPPRQR